MDVIEFSFMGDDDMEVSGDSETLQRIAVLEWFDLEKRDMGIRFNGAYPDPTHRSVLESVHRHIGMKAQTMKVRTGGHEYLMIVDPRPERGSPNPPSLLVRYTIHAHTVN